MRLFLSLMLIATSWSSAIAAEAPPSPPAPLATLADLEARATKENGFPDATPQFHREVIRLIESNTLSSGDDFSRAANMATGPIEEYRSVRMRYELALAAVAKGNLEAEKSLPLFWDSLLRALGRPIRFDPFGVAAKNPDDSSFTREPAPEVIASVLLHPAEARDAASKAKDNAEVKKIVDADQAVRQNWNKLTPDDFKTVATEDHQRNARIRAIVNEGSLHTAQDFANAALVMQHSSGFAGFQLAHELAVCSTLLGDRGMGRWLIAATYDRMLNSVGHDQRFGTQSCLTMGNQKPALGETDEGGICDAERLALGCPTLAAKRANFWTPHPSN